MARQGKGKGKGKGEGEGEREGEGEGKGEGKDVPQAMDAPHFPSPLAAGILPPFGG